MTETHERALKIIDIILNEGVISINEIIELPKEAKIGDAYILKDDLFIFIDKWEKIKRKEGLIIWNKNNDMLWQYKLGIWEYLCIN